MTIDALEIELELVHTNELVAILETINTRSRAEVAAMFGPVGGARTIGTLVGFLIACALVLAVADRRRG